MKCIVNLLFQAKNTRCLKCKRLGHANTDKSCPLYGKSRLDADADLFDELDKKAEAENAKPKIKEEPIHSSYNQSYLVENNSLEFQINLDMLRALTKKEKKRILKRLKRLESKKLIPSK